MLLKATVTTCPFVNTENLADIAEEGTSEADKEMETLLQTLKTSHPEIADQLTQLDDLHFKALTAAQNNTLRKTICPLCNTRTFCKPEQQ